ncbi:rhodanese-like domain-containing protein [Polaromonas sp.]|uniref:rhodanese-like domain-containing protein n=1 Tax=Polaromonas sp. TaxID=1869339 RepID=UPI0017C04984|nr:rhodanese-like domain-containing protein [Polaromonas sp.]NML85281.1 sulfurtransferase [Polaromonas sp.]
MIPQLNPRDFAAWRDSARASGGPAALPVVLDVREPWEVQTASVTPDGFTLVHIPVREIPARLESLRQAHGADQPIACICHHGMRSMQAANYLAQSGFGEVINLQGGIDAWSEQVDPSVARY